MPIRLYIDEDAMARAFVSGLRARDVDLKTVFEEGMLGQSDEVQPREKPCWHHRGLSTKARDKFNTDKIRR